MSDESVATAEHGGAEYDALETLKPGEGVFPLQYGDPLAIMPAKLWARLARRFGLIAKDPAVREKYLRKATMAENAVWEMIEYQKGQAPVEGRRASYNDQAVAVDFGDQIKARKALIANVAALHNAAGIAKAVEEAIDEHPGHLAAAHIRLAIKHLNEAAPLIDPRRDNERT